MIPFSGFMQPFSGQHRLSGETAIGLGKAGPGSAKHGTGPCFNSEATPPFLDWVRRLMGSGQEGASALAEAIGADLGELVADPSGLEALQALVAASMVRNESVQPAAETGGIDPSADTSMMPEVLVAHGEGTFPRHADRGDRLLAAVHRVTAAGNEGPAEAQGASGAVIAGTPGEKPANINTGRLEQASQPEPGNPVTPRPMEAAPLPRPLSGPHGQPVPTADSPAERTSEASPTRDAGQTMEFPFAPAPPTTAKTNPASAASMHHPPEAPKAAAPVSDPAADQSGADAQDAAAPARHDGQATTGLRADVPDGEENGGKHLHPMDSVKPGNSDTARAAVAFQDAARSAGVDKPVAAVPTASTGTDASTVRDFQHTVMHQIVERASVRSIQGRSEIHIRLKPEFLGHVQMHVVTDKEQVVVRMLTDQPAVKEIIERNLHQLKTELHTQGLTIDKFDVMVNPDADHQHHRESFAHMFKHAPMPHNRRDGRGQGQETPEPHADGQTGRNPSDGEGINYFA